MDLEGAPNFRDLGGIPAVGGRRIAPRRLYRSEVLDALSAADLERLARTPFSAVCDLRRPDEREAEIGLWPPAGSVRLITAEPIVDFDVVQQKHWTRRLLDDSYGPEQARRQMVGAYHQMPEGFAGVLTELFEHLEHAEGAVLIHCMAGKDRTGFVVAMLLSALGAPPDAILEDYLETGRRWRVPPKVEHILDRLFEGRPPARARDAAREIGSVRPEYLQAAFDKIEADAGSVATYLERLAGPGRIERLRTRLLVEP
jgi:protein-tyrosine phosphatase